MYTKDSVYYFSLFEKYPQLIQGISTRAYGPITQNKILIEQNLHRFLGKLTIRRDQVVFCDQIHGGNSTLITTNQHITYPNSDGLITAQKNIFLGIRTADCLPVLLFDPKLEIVGNLHAGYKGLFAGILENGIMQFQKLGSKIEDIRIGIGPGIGICCYDVPKERVARFSQRFSFLKKFFVNKNNTYYLDIAEVASQVIKHMGVPNENIENAKICTKDTDDFFSHRGGIGVPMTFLSIIGIKDL